MFALLSMTAYSIAPCVVILNFSEESPRRQLLLCVPREDYAYNFQPFRAEIVFFDYLRIVKLCLHTLQ